MKLEESKYLASVKPLLKKLLAEILKLYPYASILATDSVGYRYSVNKRITSMGENALYTYCGFVIKAFDGHAYGEYSFNEISEELIPEIVKTLKEKVIALDSVAKNGISLCEYKQLNDEPLVFSKATEYKVAPWELGDEEIIKRLTELKDMLLSKNEAIINASAAVSYQKYTKLFLSPNRDMTQTVMWSDGYLFANSKKGDVVHDAMAPFSALGGFEIMDDMKAQVDKVVQDAIDLLDAEPLVPGTYECICDPSTTGMIVHEAFGHGVEMDMFVKDRAQAKEYIGKRVASDLITMHDGASAYEQTGSFFFDDEGVIAKDTIIIKNGILVTGMSDAQSAMYLGTEPTGNGRRQDYRRKAYTRMTNTYFEAGNDKLEDMIASVKDGLLLEHPTSGMEDPKNWGIQCMVDVAREIKDGKLTGRIFSPCILSGYVPDLLCSISMVSDTAELSGTGMCGKGYKEWVKVSDGGPYIKAKIRLG